MFPLCGAHVLEVVGACAMRRKKSTSDWSETMFVHVYIHIFTGGGCPGVAAVLAQGQVQYWQFLASKSTFGGVLLCVGFLGECKVGKWGTRYPCRELPGRPIRFPGCGAMWGRVAILPLLMVFSVRWTPRGFRDSSGVTSRWALGTSQRSLGPPRFLLLRYHSPTWLQSPGMLTMHQPPSILRSSPAWLCRCQPCEMD